MSEDFPIHDWLPTGHETLACQFRVGRERCLRYSDDPIHQGPMTSIVEGHFWPYIGRRIKLLEEQVDALIRGDTEEALKISVFKRDNR